MSDTKNPFKFALGQDVKSHNFPGEGTVTGCTVYAYGDICYQVRFVGLDGRYVERWFAEQAIWGKKS